MGGSVMEVCSENAGLQGSSLSGHWAIPFNKGIPPMDDLSVSVPGGIDMLG